jgi:hypothetical protein
MGSIERGAAWRGKAKTFKALEVLGPTPLSPRRPGSIVCFSSLPNIADFLGENLTALSTSGPGLAKS